MDPPTPSDVLRDLSGKSQRSNSTPLPHKPHGRPDADRRKKLLRGLLDTLVELQEDDLGSSASRGGKPDNYRQDTFDDYREGAEDLQKFESSVKNLDRQLRIFPNTVMELGSSVVLVPASFALRKRLAGILYLFHQNAALLFPHRESKVTDVAIEHLRGFARPSPRSETLQTLEPRLQAGPSEKLQPKSFPDEVEGLADDAIKFLHCLNQFPYFDSVAVNESITAFSEDLRYRASCLREYSGQFESPSVARYIHDLSVDIGERLPDITSALAVFIEVGVPIVRFVQSHESANLSTLSTMATFFSAVTATTIQYTLGHNTTRLEAWVNAFWYSSLVFSIASAVNSLIGLTWKQAMYRSPENRVPSWIRLWIKHTPLAFSVISVAAFLVGFVLFTYTSGQSRVVCLLITIFTGCTSCGLIAACAWLVFERWAFAIHKGHVLPDDILNNLIVKLRRVLGLDWAMTNIRLVVNCLSGKASRIYQSTAARRVSTLLSTYHRSSLRASPPAESILPLNDPSQTISPNQRPVTSLSPLQISPTSDDIPHADVDSPDLLVMEGPSALPDASTPVKTTSTKGRMKKIAGTVMMINRSFGMNRRTQGIRSRPKLLGQLTTVRLARRQEIKRVLQGLSSQSVTPHQELVTHLAFSPDREYLAACSVDGTSTIIRVSDLDRLQELPHPDPDSTVGQVVWSPDSSFLLTRTTNAINVWTKGGMRTQHIGREAAVQSIKWFANRAEFLSIESSEAVHMDLNGKVLASFRFQGLRLHDVTITSDEKRLFAVATLEHSENGRTPVKARAEKRIVVYNCLTKKIEQKIPFLHEVRDITLSNDGRSALVSYEDKTPPQLWRISTVTGDPILSFVHSYMPNQETEFAGKSFFGSRGDELVTCASKAGDIYIWHCKSGSLLHHVRPEQDDENTVSCIAWNAMANYMFATGSRAGAVQLWQVTEEVKEEEREQKEGEGSKQELERGKEEADEEKWFLEALRRMQEFDRPSRTNAVAWIPTDGDDIPPEAIEGGWEEENMLYIARAYYKGGTYLGKAGLHLGPACNIGFRRQEIKIDPYEILVGDIRRVKWVHLRGAFKLDRLNGAKPVEGGYEVDGTLLFIIQASYMGGVHPGRVSEKLDQGLVCYGGREHNVSDYSVLCYA